MADYDQLLIQPSAEELEDAVGAAVTAVNGKARKRRLPWPMAEYAAFSAEAARLPEGWKQWNADGRPGDVRSALGVAWWADHIGRRHFRLVGGRIGRELVADLFGRRAANRPPLWRVYPEFAFVCVRSGQRLVKVLCRCGAAGSPVELGWMGDCCGACHDRREAGVPVPTLWRRAIFCHPSDARISPFVLALSPEGSTLAVGDGERLTLWDVGTGQELRTLRRAAWLSCPAFSPDGQTLATWSTLGALLLWDVATGQEKGSFPTSRDIHCLAWSPDGSVLALAGYRGVLLLERDTGQEVRAFRDEAGVTCLAFSPDGSLLAVGTRTGTVRVWDTKTGEERLTLNHLGYRLGCVAFSSTWDGSLFPAHGRPVLAAVGPSGNQLSGAAADGGTVQFFPPLLGAGGTRIELPDHPQGMLTGAFSPEGRLFVTGGGDGTLRLWDLATGTEEAALEWHQQQVGHLEFSADGRWLLSASFPDGVVRLWPWQALRTI